MQADVGVAMGAGTDIVIESADIVIVGNRLASILRAREISRYSCRKTKQNVTLAFLFNGIGIPRATTGLVYPVWAMVVMALSVSSIFVNSLWGRPRLFFDAILSVGRGVPVDDGEAVALQPDPAWATGLAGAGDKSGYPRLGLQATLEGVRAALATPLRPRLRVCRGPG